MKLWRVAVTLLPIMAVAFGSFFVGGPSTANAAGISTGLGVGCSVSSVNGVKTVTLKLKVSASAPSELMEVDLQKDGVSVAGYPNNSVGGNTYSANETVAVGNTTASYFIEWSASTATLSSSRTALATVSVNGSSVGCRVQSPAPPI